MDEFTQSVMNPDIGKLMQQLKKYDNSTHHHCVQVAFKTSLICMCCYEKKIISAKEYPYIIAGALLHDIGKIKIPLSIINKPTRLNMEEYLVIQEHSRIGHDICVQSGIDKEICRIVYEHHERADASGYPENKGQTEICIGARIVAIADSIDALMSVRPYKKQLTFQEAIERIKSTDRLYDKDILESLIYLNKLYDKEKINETYNKSKNI